LSLVRGRPRCDMRVLVTGATGFVGRHLALHLAAEAHEVVGASLDSSALGVDINSVPLDACDRSAVRRLLGGGFDVVYHLAFNRIRPAAMVVTALEGTAILLEEAARVRRPPRIAVVSSGAVYGHASGTDPLREDDLPAPATFYAVLKHAQEELAASHVRAWGLPVVILRPFNLIGPGEDGTLVSGAAARQIASGEHAGGPITVRVGNVESYRDFIDVRDAVRGFTAAVAAGEPGEAFNVCSGHAVQVRALLELLRARARRPCEFAVRDEPLSGADIPYQVGSAARLRARTGWEPRISLEQSVADLLDHMREYP
jgi:GDP-4-dehydro-6-deoxy-D-mannose reductase